MRLVKALIVLLLDLVMVARNVQILQFEVTLVSHEEAEDLHLRRPRDEKAHGKPPFQLIRQIEEENEEWPRFQVLNVSTIPAQIQYVVNN